MGYHWVLRRHHEAILHEQLYLLGRANNSLKQVGVEPTRIWIEFETLYIMRELEEHLAHPWRIIPRRERGPYERQRIPVLIAESQKLRDAVAVREQYQKTIDVTNQQTGAAMLERYAELLRGLKDK